MTNRLTVFASYFNGVNDPQRKERWIPDTSCVMNLISSITGEAPCANIKIFHDCFVDPPVIEQCEWIKVLPVQDYVPSVYRWIVYKSYLEENFLDSYIFAVDSTDVEMHNNPLHDVNRKTLYCGSEYNRKNFKCAWIEQKLKFLDIPEYVEVLNKYANEDLLNAGIVGGHVEIFKKFLDTLTDYHANYSYNQTSISLDMPIFNYVAFRYFSDKISYGTHVNTPFKKYQKKSKSTSWWRHK